MDMETKLQTALCALLLLVNLLGSTALLGDDPTAPSSTAAGTFALGKLTIEGSNTSTTSNGSSSSSSSSTSNNTAITSVSPLILHQSTGSPPDAQDDNEGHATSMDHPVVSPFPEKESNLTEESPTQPLLPPSDNSIATSPVPPITTTTTTTTTSPTHTAHIVPTHTPLTTPRHSTLPHTPAHSTSPSSPPASPSTRRHKTNSSTPAPTAEVPGQPRRTTPETAASTGIQPSLNSSTSSPQKVPGSQAPMVPSPQTTAESNPHPETSGAARPESTFTPPGSPSAQAKAHADTPSQLNVGGDTTVVHEPPTLDPLLAGLVSAFIITAVIITLLIFLKLRRRDNRPEFRRLQDLPMDDMMEDTPLSMYSY